MKFGRVCWTHLLHRFPYPAQALEESTGAFGERLAIAYLRREGYKILEHSYACPLGEIDIIAVWRKRLIVFIEVKTWTSVRVNSGGPADAVDDVKQRKICRTALHYAKKHGLLDTPGRFDVIEISLGQKPRYPNCRHIQAAFESQEQFQMHA